MDEECCPVFDPAPWDGKTHIWEDKRFVRDHVRTFFYIPLNFGTVITRMNGAVEAAGAGMPDRLCLSDHTSKWNMDILLAVDREVPGMENVTLSGTYMSKAYEGPFKETGKWCSDFESYVKESGRTIRKLYMWYTTCPKCARKYGKNPVVVLAEVG